jgi:hypothetical protein
MARFLSPLFVRRSRNQPVPGRDAVVFSSYVPTAHALEVSKEFLGVFRERFSDCDFYVGINTGSVPEWEQALNDSGLRLAGIAHVPPRLMVDSDVSGFQAALKSMRDAGKEYQLVWFGHTKGATADHPGVRRHLIEGFFLDRARIERLFDEPRVGAFGYDMSIELHNLGDIDSRMDSLVLKFPYATIGTFYLHTFYVIRGSIVGHFLGGCSEVFFTRNLVDDLGFDRYFFERDFARITERSGYYPTYAKRNQHMSSIPVTRRNTRTLYRAWEQQLPHSLRTKLRFR